MWREFIFSTVAGRVLGRVRSLLSLSQPSPPPNPPPATSMPKAPSSSKAPKPAAPAVAPTDKTSKKSNKVSTSAAGPAPAAAPPKPKASFDIDSIFAGGGSSSSSRSAPPAQLNATAGPSSVKPKKKMAKASSVDAAPSDAAAAVAVHPPKSAKSKKGKQVVSVAKEEVVDPSLGVGKKVDNGPAAGVPDDVAAFMDSRGEAGTFSRLPVDFDFLSTDVYLYLASASTGRKTDEGYRIFKEAALAIDPEAGGEFPPSHLLSPLTSLTPDSRCFVQTHRFARSTATAVRLFPCFCLVRRLRRLTQTPPLRSSLRLLMRLCSQSLLLPQLTQEITWY